jgi:molybdopterin synthase catalytic subunit
LIRIQRDDFDVGAEVARLTGGNTAIGGVCVFVGLVRDMAGAGGEDADRIGAMTLEHYPGMTERQLERIDREAHARWPLEDTLIVHRHGRLEPGERIVLVAAASKHRQAAFDACHFLIDWLKTQAPFWKVEETPDGDRWVESRASDGEAADRWMATDKGG